MRYHRLLDILSSAVPAAIVAAALLIAFLPLRAPREPFS
jgi:hypothetical protein